MLDLNTKQYLVETKYAARKSDEPLLSVTKTATYLNSAFREQHFKGSTGRQTSVFVQLFEQGGKNYLLISNKKVTNFYCGTLTSTNVISITAKGFREVLGKKNKTVRYKLQLEKTSDPSIKAYELVPFVEDDVKSKELDSSFKVG